MNDYEISEFCGGYANRIKRLEQENRKLQRACKKWFDKARENKKEVVKLLAQIDKMKCCENCKYNSYWGNELHCNYGLKEALQEDKLVECHNLDKWELKE